MKKQIIKEISSGGFIFYKDASKSKIYVILIENSKNEYWIPKGKLEKNETQIEAAYREISEEVGFNSNQLKQIGSFNKYKYEYHKNNSITIKKDLFVNVFAASKKYRPKPTDWNDMLSVNWYLYEDAIKIISFTKDKLEAAHTLFLRQLDVFESSKNTKSDIRT